MELLSATIKEYNGSLNISMEVNLLQQLLPELVSLEQMLKQKESTNASTGECSRVNKEVGSLKNSRWKYSRLKQKIHNVGEVDKLFKQTCSHSSKWYGHYTTTWNFGPQKYTCQYCGALLWEPPPYLKYLLGKESGKLGINFRKNIRAYNSMFAFTSMGGRVDGSINHSKGPYVFWMCGQNYHRIGSLLPKIEGDIDPEIVQGLSVMLEEHNILVKTFGMAKDRYKEHPEREFHLRLLSNRKNGLQRISDLHSSFMSMTYPLIHPYGEDGYRVGINLGDVIDKDLQATKINNERLLLL
uniref:Uncharacterized protein n=1 Tax=Solanum lycopersicum TaxID=4081 RepID=A0A3Q7EEM9_SOLLC